MRITVAPVNVIATAVAGGVFNAGNVGYIDTALASLVEKRSEVLLVSPSVFFSSHRTQIVLARWAERKQVAALQGAISYW